MKIIKRIFDLIASMMGLIILFIPLLVVGIIIKFDSEGPIFFKQKRLGLNGEVFEIIKFRTMVNNAEKMGAGLKIEDKNDSRITKVGDFLRKTSIDELPQLLNVIKGEMSLVGPRPPATYFPYEGMENYPEWAKDRFKMRPGITGLAQVTVRNSVSWDERIKYDIKYINEFSLGLDIVILMKTVLKVFKSENIYS